MDNIWSILCIFICLLFVFTSPSDAITCQSCSDQLSNERCNIATTSCAGSCYTTIKKLESVGTRYFKGCMDTTACENLGILNHRKYCPFFPSECTYCCTDRDSCNDFNAANSLYNNRQVIISMVAAAIFVLQLR